MVSMRSVVSYDTTPSQVAKKERLRRGKDTQEAAVVLSSKQTVSIDNEVSVAQELDKVRKALKAAWREKPSVDFFSFVIDPDDFSKSVSGLIYFCVQSLALRWSWLPNGILSLHSPRTAADIFPILPRNRLR
ncbi:hypothetical protein COOONC_17820 [Cooperia oncophora]